jgi:hypothetical protein
MGGMKTEGDISRIEYHGARSEIEAQVTIPAAKCFALAVAVAITGAAIATLAGAFHLLPVARLCGLAVGSTFAAAYFGRDMWRGIMPAVEVAFGKDLDGDGMVGNRSAELSDADIDDLALWMLGEAYDKKRPMSRREWVNGNDMTPAEWEAARARLLVRGVTRKNAKGEAVLMWPEDRAKAIAEYRVIKPRMRVDADGDLRGRIA